MKETYLHSCHVALNAKMGEFAGYDMPLYYADGVMKEHEWTRSHAGLFDVSHMGQIILEGAGVIAFLERITPSSYGKYVNGFAKYTVLINEYGGIIDDLIVTRMGDTKFFAVINAGCKEKDIAWMLKNLPADVTLTRLDDRALIALQGQSAENALREALGVNAADLGYMRMMEVSGMFVSRLGYTGEDGFEISVAGAKAVATWNKLMAHTEVKPVGLAARDSLRLEMGYPLYGHDIDDTTSPIEADLSWVMGKDNTGFIGAERVLREKSGAPSRKRIGIKLTDKGVARENTPIVTADGKQVGMMTSGGFSPSTKESIGQGYVESALAVVGQKLFVDVRGRKIAAELCAMPFLPPRTKAAKKAAA